MHYSTVVVLLFASSYAFALPVANNPFFIEKEIKFDGSSDWSRVVGGSTAATGQFPYIASLRRSTTRSHFCGGVIVSGFHILTAAHCTVGVSPASIIVVVGTTTLNTGGTTYEVDRITSHIDYDSETIANDISILRLSSPITGSSTVASIPIGSSALGGGFTVTLSGWGSTSSGSALPNNLQFIDLRTISNNECASRNSPYPVFNSSICTFTQAGQGACNGDSGGPLVYDGILVGLVSWGIPCALGYADVFTRISYYVEWIQNNAS